MSCTTRSRTQPNLTERLDQDLVDLYVRGNNVSLNNYAGLQSMSGFDNFRGSGNFDGSQNAQVVVVQEQQTSDVILTSYLAQIIQQKLVVLQEIAKRIIIEQICEVETQTIVLEQFSSGLTIFQKDISRTTTKQVGYDKNVASLIGNITNSDGSLSSSDLGFNGTSVGSNTVVPTGSNWNNTQGPDAVQKALSAAQAAANSTSS
ncbi:hypothetical protein J3R30DRAFT_3657678 [Lentinula aciculospora]|uniref:Uncharacterized protein n=1 Tax=Lentinula aciculospora TaxID=153920 RepID=A0A9W9A9V5_9AGAR|nr:hypothetical protein J3R30DRAFT_3657678 [Lentinula aciculospora]